MSGRVRGFGLLKEAIAADRPETALATGAAMCAEVLQFPVKDGGRNLEGREAARVVALVSLGKKVILFRHGNFAAERAGAIDELAVILKKAKARTGQPIVRFNEDICRCIAAVALWELAADMCTTCMGAGEVPLASVIRGKEIDGPQPMTCCPSCHGKRRKIYYEDERIKELARAWCEFFPPIPGDTEAVTIVANRFREEISLNKLMAAIDYGKGRLLEAERVCVEEAARMTERWTE